MVQIGHKQLRTSRATSGGLMLQCIRIATFYSYITPRAPKYLALLLECLI